LLNIGVEEGARERKTARKHLHWKGRGATKDENISNWHIEGERVIVTVFQGGGAGNLMGRWNAKGGKPP